MRCRECDRILTYLECVHKDEKGNYLDTCDSCIEARQEAELDAEIESDHELKEEIERLEFEPDEDYVDRSGEC